MFLSRSLAGVPVSFARGLSTPDSCHFAQDYISRLRIAYTFFVIPIKIIPIERFGGLFTWDVI